MALKAGRVGVDPQELDAKGKIKIYIPAPKVADAGKILAVASDGTLAWKSIPTDEAIAKTNKKGRK